MAELNLIKLSDTEIVIDKNNNDIYIDYKILNLTLEQGFETSKELHNIFKKNIYFRFNGYYMEVNNETTIEQVESSYQYQEKIHHKNHVNKVLKNAINRLEESNIKLTIEEVYKELALNNPDSIYRNYIRLCDQKQFASKLYMIYRQNHNSERIELLPPVLEIPKVMIKK